MTEMNENNIEMNKINIILPSQLNSNEAASYDNNASQKEMKINIINKNYY